MEKITPLTLILFLVSTGLTGWIFWKASKCSRSVFIALVTWLMVTGVLALTGFYLVFNVLPPRLIFAVAPPLIFIAILFSTSKGKVFINDLNIEQLTLLHVVRIPVEIGLHALFIGALIPELMTYDGYNLDILSGITAPIIYYFGFIKKKLNHTILLLWNFLCLALLINIVTLAILSTPSTFQQLAFDQPNIGVLYFPIIWLPAIIVPIVLLSHLVTIKKLLTTSKETKPASLA